MRNALLLEKIAARIEETPDLWDQRYFSNDYQDRFKCNTSHCIGGWAVALSGKAESFPSWEDDDTYARELLGLTMPDAEYLFFGGFSISQDRVGEVADSLRRIAAGEHVAEALPEDWYPMQTGQ